VHDVYPGTQRSGAVLINQLFAGSLLSNERLMEAREHYSPTTEAKSPEEAFARWTQRVSLQSELGSAREMAGLTEEELSQMEAEFVRCPKRIRSARARAVPTGAVLTSLGAVGVGVHSFLAGTSEAGRQAILMGSGVVLVAGLIVLAISVLSAFGALHLELSHGTTGLYFGRLDEQHPWLYKTVNLTHHPAAEAYRRHVLRERGWLRGLDYVMMRETVRVHDAMERTLPTRLVAERIQLLQPRDENAASPALRGREQERSRSQK